MMEKHTGSTVPEILRRSTRFCLHDPVRLLDGYHHSDVTLDFPGISSLQYHFQVEKSDAFDTRHVCHTEGDLFLEL